MKILLVADLHYTLKQWDWVNHVSERFDLVVVAGDLLDIVSPVDLEVQILVVRKYLKRIAPRVRLLVSSGNHDGDARNDAGESVAAWIPETGSGDGDILVDGDSFEENDLFFTICPWWDGPETKAEVAELFARDVTRAEGKSWIWVYHAPPADSPVSWTGKKFYGDSALCGWIGQYRPAMVLSGHVHHAPFANEGSWVDRIDATLVFNMGRQIGPVPAHIVLDTDAGSARWYSLAGNEVVSLEGPVKRRELG
ncbi:MAG: metallophosphoesterase [Verrucomicrobiales bacterium]